MNTPTPNVNGNQRKLLNSRLREDAMDVKSFVTSIDGNVTRVPGTAVLLTSDFEAVPHAMLHSLKLSRMLYFAEPLLFDSEDRFGNEFVAGNCICGDVPELDQRGKLLWAAGQSRGGTGDAGGSVSA